MRELKFRAYSKKFKGMIYESKTYHIDVVANTVWKDLIDDEAPILMQFTGLKDRNGEEIYEGDIIKVSEMYDDNIDYCDSNFVVEWVKDFCSFGLTTKPNEEMYRKFQMPLDIRYWEIVGNIYENPELLKR